MDKTKIAIVAIFTMLFLVAMIKADGFGEYSGYLVYNISVNTSHTEAWTLVNSYNYSLTFRVVPPDLNLSSSSNVTPTLTFSAMNGTIPADSNYQINVTVFIPANATVHTFWQGYATAFASGSPNQSNTSSAKIQIGTAKLIQITAEAAPPKKTTKPTTSTSVNSTTVMPVAAANNGNSVYYIAAIAVLGAALLAVVAYMMGSRNRNGNSGNQGNARRRAKS